MVEQIVAEAASVIAPFAGQLVRQGLPPLDALATTPTLFRYSLRGAAAGGISPGRGCDCFCGPGATSSRSWPFWCVSGSEWCTGLSCLPAERSDELTRPPTTSPMQAGSFIPLKRGLVWYAVLVAASLGPGEWLCYTTDPDATRPSCTTCRLNLKKVPEQTGTGLRRRTRQLGDDPYPRHVGSAAFGLRKLRDKREATTLATSLEKLNKDEVSPAIDVISMLLLAVQETKQPGGSWEKASLKELVAPTTTGGLRMAGLSSMV